MRLLNNFFTIESANPTEGGILFVVRFNADSEIYRAHFPGQPITPGVCIVQTAKELLEEHLKAEVELSAAKNVKFLSVIVPEEDKTFTYELTKIQEAEGQIKFSTNVISGDTVYAKMSLTCKRK